MCVRRDQNGACKVLERLMDPWHYGGHVVVPLTQVRVLALVDFTSVSPGRVPSDAHLQPWYESRSFRRLGGADCDLFMATLRIIIYMKHW